MGNTRLAANDLEHSVTDDIRQRLFAPTERQSGDFGRRKETRVVLPALPSWSERIGVPAFFTARNHAQAVLAASGTKPSVFSLKHFSAMRQDVTYAVRLMMQEKEILLFAALQWLVIGIAYLMWTQVLDWIPDSVWAEVARDASDKGGTSTDWANLAIWGWSLLVIATAAYPLALLNASIVASHYLKSSGQASTVPACLNLASKNLGRVWLFTALDALITAGAILDRLPSKKRRKRTAVEEAAYYAWKIATIGALPSLVSGKTFVDSANESVWLLEDQPVRAIGIRMGYSLICWIIGVLAYVGAIVTFIMFGSSPTGENWVYHGYVLVGAPIFVAIGIVSLIRPVFVLAISKLYTDVVPVNVEIEGTVTVESGTEIDWPTLIFAMLTGTTLALYFTS
jgi:hypothetical protein